MSSLQCLLLLGTASLLQAACPNVPVFAEFDPEKFSGVWYWTEWYDNGWISQQIPNIMSCVTSNFTMTETGNFSVELKWDNLLTEQQWTATGRLVQQATPNHFEASFPISFMIPNGQFYIIDGVHRTWAVVYTCREILFGMSQIQTAWILHRNPNGRRQRNALAKRWELKPGLKVFIDADKFRRFNDTEACSTLD
ncbi:apolipoprotein D-like [Argopecten irradians]|uniref:apolipoprotein D-like n=1 Tax=Argopecten irradians TaxID=31199 RepID=UPI0037243DC0